MQLLRNSKAILEKLETSLPKLNELREVVLKETSYWDKKYKRSEKYWY